MRAGDAELLDEYRGEHANPVATIQDELRAHFGFETGARIKRADKIVAKLRRQEHIRLSQIQDIGGVRHVDATLNFTQQTERAEAIRAHFAAATIDDRRAEPHHGYRAMHVIIKMDSKIVEVQLRTQRQDTWAVQMERLAEACDPELQYGAFAPDGSLPRSAQDELLTLSHEIGQVEFQESFTQLSGGPLNAIADIARDLVRRGAADLAAQAERMEAAQRQLEDELAAAQERLAARQLDVGQLVTRALVDCRGYL